MFFSKRLILLILLLPLFISCSGNQLEKNKTELDRIYGPCDNPLNPLKDLEKEICLAKQRGLAPGGEMPEEFSLTDFISNRNNTSVSAYQGVNQILWNSSLHTLKKFPIKSSDIVGGYIETDWIYDINDSSKRCLIKIQITSTELISTGVTANFLCQQKSNDVWVSDNNEYIEEAKNLKLQILNNTKLFNQ